MSRYDDEIGDPWTGEKPKVLKYDGIERPPRTEDLVRRNHDGRPYIRALNDDGTVSEREIMHSRVTTYIKCVDDTSLLDWWKRRQQAKGFAMAPDYFQAVIMQHWEDREGLNKICEEATKRAGAQDQAAIGTAVHALTEQHDQGWHIPFVPDKYQADLLAWVDATRHFEIIEIEQMMVNDVLRTAGTPDRVVRYHRCSNCGRDKYILDLKTGRVDHYTELQIAMQLGLYGNSDFYNFDTGERRPHEDICRCQAIVINLPAGTGEAIVQWVDIYTGWEVVVEVARRVREARKHKNLLRAFVPTADLFTLIERAETRSDLDRVYHEHRGIWTPEHTAAATTKVKESQWR